MPEGSATCRCDWPAFPAVGNAGSIGGSSAAGSAERRGAQVLSSQVATGDKRLPPIGVSRGRAWLCLSWGGLQWAYPRCMGHGASEKTLLDPNGSVNKCVVGAYETMPLQSSTYSQVTKSDI